MKLKLIVALLLCVMLLTTVIACSSGDGGTGTASTTTTISDSGTIDENSEPDIYADLPTGDYDGYVFRILNNESNFALTQMDSEDQTGEPINDAIYDRNRLVEERLNIKIQETMVSYSVVTSTITKSVAAGEDAYDIFFNESYFVAPLALENYLVNVYEIDNLNFDKPWWAGDMIESLSIGGKLYMLAGDIHLMLPEATWMLAFNKLISDNLSLENPYDLVNDGTWTLDKVNEMAHSAVADLNGDGEMSADVDQFGGVLYISPTNFMISAGVNFVSKDSDNLPVYSGLSERDYSVYTKIIEKIYASGDFAIRGKTKGVPDSDDWVNIFSTGHSLFLVEPIGSLKKLREMDDEFGIVPFPKYDELQDNYISLTAHYSAVMGIPVTSSDLDRTGTILEQLSAISYRDVRSVYYDVILQGKYSRDTESEAMLDIVLNSRRFDLMQVYRWGSLIDTLNSQAGSLNTDIVSAVEAVASKVETAIQETINFYTNLS